MSSNPEHLISRIRETLSNLSDEELIKILRSRGNYTRFALQVAREELAKRNQFKAAIQQMDQESIEEAKHGSEDEQLKSNGCYVELWRDKNFEGERICIQGPAECSALRFAGTSWGDSISSLRAGPGAFVLVYESKDFKGKTISVGPNQEIPDLQSLKFDNEIDSIKVIDSIKIFDRSGSGDEIRIKSRRKSKKR